MDGAAELGTPQPKETKPQNSPLVNALANSLRSNKENCEQSALTLEQIGFPDAASLMKASYIQTQETTAFIYAEAVLFQKEPEKIWDQICQLLPPEEVSIMKKILRGPGSEAVSQEIIKGGSTLKSQRDPQLDLKLVDKYTKLSAWRKFWENEDAKQAQPKSEDVQTVLPQFVESVPLTSKEKQTEPFAYFSLAEITQRFPDCHEPKTIDEAIKSYLPHIKKEYSSINLNDLEVYQRAGLGEKEKANQRAIRFLGFGKDQMAILLEDGSVLKIVKPVSLKSFKDDYDYPDYPNWGKRPFDIPVGKSGEVVVNDQTIGWHIEPFVAIMDHHNAEDLKATEGMSAMLYDQGYDLADYHPYQLGRDQNGKVWVADYEAVKPFLEFRIDSFKKAGITGKEYASLRAYRSEHMCNDIEKNSNMAKTNNRDYALEAIRVLGVEKFKLYYGQQVFDKIAPFLPQ